MQKDSEDILSLLGNEAYTSNKIVFHFATFALNTPRAIVS